MKKLRLDAEWSDDCNGKKDFEGRILSINTRYWPRGGGFFAGEPGMPIEGNESRPKIRPSAKSSLLLNHGGGDEESITIVEKTFEAETQEEVQTKVEEWAQARFDEIVAILAEHYKV